jgi:hypothetical protein
MGSRALTPSEIDYINDLYQGTVSVQGVRIHDDLPLYFTKEKYRKFSAFTPNSHNIYVREDYFRDDFTLDKTLTAKILAHEFAHIQQAQTLG